MKIDIDYEFFDLLGEVVCFITEDKPRAVKKFKIDLMFAKEKI